MLKGKKKPILTSAVSASATLAVGGGDASSAIAQNAVLIGDDHSNSIGYRFIYEHYDLLRFMGYSKFLIEQAGNNLDAVLEQCRSQIDWHKKINKQELSFLLRYKKIKIT